MKKLLLTFAAVALVFAGCTKDLKERVDSLEERMDAVEAAVDKLTSEVEDMQKIVDAFDGKLAISSVANIDGGYKITFSDNSSIELLHGVTPTVSLIEVGGVLCWAVNGTPLTDGEGNTVPAVGQQGPQGENAPVPSFEIDENGDLTVTIGEDVKNLGKVAGEDGKNGDSWFSGVAVSEDGLYCTITLTAGGQIVLPMYVELDIVFAEGFEYNLYDKIEVPFTIKGNAENAVVRAYPSKDWTAVVGESSITVTAGSENGYVDVYLIDNATGAIKAKSLSFTKDAAVIVDKDSYLALAAGGNVEVPVSKYVDYEVEISDTWLSSVDTKAPTSETLVLSASSNADGSTRTATVSLKVNGVAVASFEVSQKGYIAGLIGEDREYAESFTYSESEDGSRNPKLCNTGTFKITLSDDPYKGTYYIDGIYSYPNYMNVPTPGTFYADSDGRNLTILAANGHHPNVMIATNLKDITLTVSDDCNVLEGPAVAPFSTGFFLNYKATLIGYEPPAEGDAFIDKIVGDYDENWGDIGSNSSFVTKGVVSITKKTDTEVTIIGLAGKSTSSTVGIVDENAKTLKVANQQMIEGLGKLSDIIFTISDDFSTITANNTLSIGSWLYIPNYTLTKKE